MTDFDAFINKASFMTPDFSDGPTQTERTLTLDGSDRGAIDAATSYLEQLDDQTIAAIGVRLVDLLARDGRPYLRVMRRLIEKEGNTND
jgi:hypothetical protein